MPTYVEPQGAVTMDRAQFFTTVRTRASYGGYSRVVGLIPAQKALDDCYDESLRATVSPGIWQYGATANFGNPQVLKFTDSASLNMFMTFVDGMLDFDADRIARRTNYIQTLRGKADAGLLWTDLQANTEPDGNYYTAPGPAVPGPGAPAIPARTPDLLNQLKAIKWLTYGVQGDASAYSQVLLKMRDNAGGWPLGADVTSLYRAWTKCVTGAPRYRGWNSTAGQQKYPSNIGGMKVLDNTIAALSLLAPPAQGSTAWYDNALYLLGAVITSQAFTDGNKRMARLAYVLTLLKGGVNIVVPNNRLGATLGDM